MARTTPVNAGYTIINGAGTGSNGNRIDVWMEYLLGQQSVAGNYTPITVYFYAALNPGYSSTTKMDKGLHSALKVNGQAGTGVTDGGYDFSSASVINLLGSYTGNIAHESDGSKSVSLAGSFTTKSAYISGGSVSHTVTLPTIPRASTIGATDADIGKTSLIAIIVKSAAYSHSVAYQFGSLSGYINAEGQAVSTESKFTATTVAFQIPESFYTQIPASTTGKCTLFCRTYAGNTQVGETKTTVFTVTAAQSACSVSVTGTVEDVNPVTLALTGNKKRLVFQHSTARCTINAQAKNSASIISMVVSGMNLPGGVLEIPNIETTELEFWAVDSRGYAGMDIDENLQMIPYIPLSNLASVNRNDPVSGNATLRLSGSYWNGNFGLVANSLTVQYRIDGGEWITAADAVSIGNGTYSGVVRLSGLDYTRAYGLEVKVADALCQQTKQLTVYKGYPVFEWGEHDFQFYVPVTAPNLKAPVSGVYMQNARVWGGNSITVQSRFAGLDSGGARQSIFLFGVADRTPVSGIVCISSDGSTTWTGTDGVQVGSMDATGRIVIQLPSGAFDHFGLISPYVMEVVS